MGEGGEKHPLFRDRLRRYVSASVSSRTKPGTPPVLSADMIALVREAVLPGEAPFIQHLEKVDLYWLDSDADCLGLTSFELKPHELLLRKRTKLPPGPTRIGLHPVLAEDEALLAHTLAHELLHAAGLLDHDGRHAELVAQIAPSPSLAESPVLSDIRQQALAAQEVQSWDCAHCGFSWSRTTVRAPARCPKCARRFKRVEEGRAERNIITGAWCSWISFWPSKPETWVRILTRSPTACVVARFAHIWGAGRRDP